MKNDKFLEYLDREIDIARANMNHVRYEFTHFGMVTFNENQSRFYTLQNVKEAYVKSVGTKRRYSE